MFADDSAVYWSGRNLEDVISQAQADLARLSEYLKSKKLCLNVLKTKFMIIGNKRVDLNVTLEMNGEQIERVNCTKYLGVQVDEKLNFIEHVDYVIKKVARKYGVLCRINKSLTFSSKLAYVKSVIMPHLDYCSTVLIFASDTQLRRLQRLQNKIMRVVLRCSRYTPSSLMLDMLQWLSVKQRIIYNCLVFLHIMKTGKLPAYLEQGVQYNNDVHRHNTRGAADFRLPRYLKTTTQRSLYYRGFKFFNSLPQEAKDTTNLAEFKRLSIDFVRAHFN